MGSLFNRMFFNMMLFQIALFASCAFKSATGHDERNANISSMDDQILPLSGSFSSLDFSANNTPASEGDVEGQLKLRASRFWGRLYIDGWPQTIQYLRAHFGIEPPLGRKIFVFPEPRDACTEILNPGEYTVDYVLLVHRGNCTFGTKAHIAARTAASAIIIINNEPGVEHLSGPDAQNIKYSVSSIPQTEGMLLESVFDQRPSRRQDFGRTLEGYMVPVNCENEGARCMPTTYEERRAITSITEGGCIHLSDSKGSSLGTDDLSLEFLLANFGVKMVHHGVKLGIVAAQPDDACSPLLNSTDMMGKAVLVKRGGCAFHTKAMEVERAGGRVMVMGNYYLDPYILRMGVEPRWLGLTIGIPVVMVSPRAYSILLNESHLAHGRIFFEENSSVSSSVWGPLEHLIVGEGEFRDESAVLQRLNELRETHKDWPDRLIAIEHAHRLRVNKQHTATTTSSAAPFSISTIITENDSQDSRVEANTATGGTSLMESEL